MEYRVLGKLEILRDGHVVDLGPFRQRAVLAMLLTRPNSVISSGEENMLKSHRALLGILFADIRRFTAFCKTAEPEAAASSPRSICTPVETSTDVPTSISSRPRTEVGPGRLWMGIPWPLH